MIDSLPNEIIRTIAEMCPLGTIASLVLSCRHIYHTCNPVLYRTDIKNHGSSAVFYAIAACSTQAVAVGTLRAARAAGADFQQCQDPRDRSRQLSHDACIIAYSPLHLAVRRGLDEVVSLLLDSGIPPDGLPSVARAPLFEAIYNRRESTAILLLQQGAQLESSRSDVDAFHASIYQSLPRLTAYLVETYHLDINSTTKLGWLPFALAVHHRRAQMIPLLIDLGADSYGSLKDLCRRKAFAHIMWILGVASFALTEALQMHEYFDLVILVATPRVALALKAPQQAVLERLLNLLVMVVKVEGEKGTSGPVAEVESFLGGLLQRVVSVGRAELGVALLLIRHGAKLQAGTLIEMIEVLRSSSLEQGGSQALRRHPKLLQSFAFIHFHFSSMPPADRGVMGRYFLAQTPEYMVRLVRDMSKQNMPLSVRGLQRMEAASLFNRSTREKALPKTPRRSIETDP